jgi:dodecin
MSVAKVIELLAEGETIEAAVENAVSEAVKTLHNVKHVYVKDIQGLVEDNRVARYRINAKVTFVVDSR